MYKLNLTSSIYHQKQLYDFEIKAWIFRQLPFGSDLPWLSFGRPQKCPIFQIAKLSFNSNLVGSCDSLIPNCSSNPPPATNQPTHPRAKDYLDICLASTSINPKTQPQPQPQSQLSLSLAQLQPQLVLLFIISKLKLQSLFLLLIKNLRG